MTKHATKLGRNDLCPCGSGRKYKRCCETREARRGSRLLLIAVGGAVLGAVVLGILQFTRSEEAAAGPRRVWSAEHGHFHNVP